MFTNSERWFHSKHAAENSVKTAIRKNFVKNLLMRSEKIGIVAKTFIKVLQIFF